LTKEEKIKKVRDAKLSIHPGWLCPLDKEPCEKKCYCFVEAYIQEYKTIDSVFISAACNNASFTKG